MFNVKIYREIQENIKKSQISSQIIAISKNQTQESVIDALNYGVRIFGENRVMEAKTKFSDLKNKFSNINLHLTGPLQSNKTKIALDIFDVFHTIDREKIVLEMSKYKNQIKSKKFFIQVNTGLESTKSGIPPNQLKNFLEFTENKMEIKISGLMCIPPISDKPSDHFELLSKLAKDNLLKELSIGMSNDYEEALKFNPRYVRLGTLLFGERK